MNNNNQPVRVLMGGMGLGIGAGCGVGVGVRAMASFNANMPTMPLPALPGNLVQRLPWLQRLRAGCGVGVCTGRHSGEAFVVYTWYASSPHSFIPPCTHQVGYGIGWGVGIPQHTLAGLLQRTSSAIQARLPFVKGNQINLWWGDRHAEQPHWSAAQHSGQHYAPSLHAPHPLAPDHTDYAQLQARLTQAEASLAAVTRAYCARVPDDAQWCVREPSGSKGG